MCGFTKPPLPLFALVLSAWLGVSAALAETVHFDSLDGTTRLRGLLQLPDGPPPFPAAVFLHGCSGLGFGGGVSALYSSWARRLNDAGLAVLMVDSVGPRGMTSTCGFREAGRRMYRDRPKDAYGALLHLQSLPVIRPDAIARMGWSQGGGITLLSIVSESIGRPSPPPEHDFKAAVAFYPSTCDTTFQHAPYTSVERGDWETDTPLLVLHGGRDNWTKPEPCRRFIESLRERQQPVAIVIYPDAAHSFDAPNVRLQRRSAPVLADGTRPLIGTDADGRADALRRVPAFLKARLKVSSR